MKLVRRNSRSALTRRNTAEILQDAAEFYPRMMEDMRAARHSIHLHISSGARTSSPSN
jgi:cardiolipin synthase A/B